MFFSAMEYVIYLPWIDSWEMVRSHEGYLDYDRQLPGLYGEFYDDFYY